MRSSALGLYLHRTYRSIWFLPSVYGIGSVAVLAMAPLFDWVVPERASELLTREALEQILSVLASSMLAVAIFSLGTMVSALEAAAKAATPRARILLTEDRTAQNAISTFIGAFIFSILGIIGLSTGYYSIDSTVTIFVVTIGLIVAVILVLISWIGRLSRIGGMAEVVRLVEQAASSAFSTAARDPFYGGRACENPPELHPVDLGRYGYIQYIDGQRLGELTEQLHADIFLTVRPGYSVRPETPVIQSSGELDDETLEQLRTCFVVGKRRTFEADPRFGLIVLSEIASKALSPAVNDSGTAIDVLSGLVRVIRNWTEQFGKAEEEIRFSHLHVIPLDVEKVVVDGFRWISRDGADRIEVAIKVQNALADIRALNPEIFGPVVNRMSEEAFQRSKNAMAVEKDVRILAEHRIRLGFRDSPD
jgi:uncharacterized membrane protein